MPRRLRSGWAQSMGAILPEAFLRLVLEADVEFAGFIPDGQR